MASYDYLIVGGGMTADAAARGIRERDPKGTIGIIGADPHPPYNRPPLTKGLWKGEAPDSIWRKTDEAGVELHLGRRARTVDAASRQVGDDRGAIHEYRRLLLATGGEPRRLPNAPEGVIYFRTLDDYRATRQLGVASSAPPSGSSWAWRRSASSSASRLRASSRSSSSGPPRMRSSSPPHSSVSGLG